MDTNKSTKKLLALLPTLTNEAEIAEVVNALQARGVAVPAEYLSGPDTEEAAVEAPKKVASLDELEALAEKCKENINKKCQVVPFNTIEWVEGYIAGVVLEKRSMKVLYAIKTSEGKRIVKVYDSNLLKISDEVVEPEIRSRKARERKERGEWSDEAIAQELDLYAPYVGARCEVEKFRIIDADGNEHVETISGRIVSLVPEKRTQKIFYRIATDEGKTMHKVAGTDGITVQELDEEGQEINQKYMARRESPRSIKTPQERVVLAEELVKKAQDNVKKAQERLDRAMETLAAARAEALSSLEATEEVEEVEEVEEAEATEATEETEDLM